VSIQPNYKIATCLTLIVAACTTIDPYTREEKASNVLRV